ncbi:fructose-bisphosphatase class II [Tepidiforma flava]|uniref:Fructose-bisphosphatase class II n=1 Tax=Tepidiforma flava TaxID=3004094 RepID=A0ABY7MAJ8_9CHLR|nr:fructose-bisphosphatase class II [Tepidiforma flava]WBL37544.1 fructose-bisphosphatase class II [Tepidiforma flava]
MLAGVEFTPRGAVSESLVMRSRSGTIRRIRAEHHWRKLQGMGNGR